MILNPITELPMILIAKTQSAAWTPVLVNPKVLETLWRNSENGNYLPTFGWPSDCRWFDRFEGSRPGMFRLAVGYFSKNKREQQAVTFNNGRHRVRWLIENMAREVPLALMNEHVESAIEFGLVLRVLQRGETFDLGFELNSGDMQHFDHPDRDCTRCKCPVAQ